MRRATQPDAGVLLQCAGAAILLLLRDALDAVPLLPFAGGLLLFVAPGVLVSGWLLGEHVRGAAVVPVAFALSTGLFGLLGIPFLVLHAGIGVYLWTCGATLAAFLAAAVLRTLRGERVDSAGDGRPQEAPAGWLWVPFALLAAALTFVSTRRAPGSYDDFWVYAAWVRDFSVSGRLTLRDPYFGEPVGALSRVKVNGWLLEQAALSRLTGVEPVEMILRCLTPALVVVALLAVCALAEALSHAAYLGELCRF